MLHPQAESDEHFPQVGEIRTAPFSTLEFPHFQDTYHVIGVIFSVLNFQLIMAGRLGAPRAPGLW